MITYNSLDIKIPKIPKRKISNWTKYVAWKFQKKVGDIAYIFCSEDKILKLNTEYLCHHFFTDVITFDYSLKKLISGDIFISIETVKSNAEKFKIDFYNELYRVMIHGVLHLCGLKDKTKQEKIAIRENENNALKILNEIFCDKVINR